MADETIESAEPGGLRARLFAVLKGPAPVYLTASVLARLGSMLLIPLYTRRLSLAEYGDFALAQSILGFLPLIYTLGLTSALPKFYFAEKEKVAARRSAGTVAVWLTAFTTAFTVLSCLGILIVAPTGSVLHQYELVCVCIAAAGSAISAVPDGVFRSEQRPYQAAAYQLGQFAAQIVMGLVFVLWLGRGLRGAIEAMAAGYAITAAVAIVFIVVSLKGRFDTRILRKAVPFALPFIPHLVAYWVQTSADRWTLKAFHLDAELGPFVLALQLTSPIGMALVAWNDVDTARLGEISRSGGIPAIAKNVNRLRLRYFLVTLAAAVFVIACLPILVRLVGSRFAPALWLSPPLALFFVVDGLFYPNSNVLYYASRTRTIAMTSVVAAAASLLLNVALIPFLGVWGAILARLLTGATRASVMWQLANRLLREDATSTPQSDQPDLTAST